jgi:ComF family protein
MHFFRHVLNFILPAPCSYCNSSIDDSGIPHFCAGCCADFARIQGSICPRCGRPFESPEALSHSPDHECGACRKNPPLFDQAVSVGYFEGPLREAVHQFKYRPCRSLGRPLGQWMVENIRLMLEIDFVMPVPLHVKRLKQRGFNQALLLAHRMSEAYRIPLSYDNLYRARPTRPQVELSGAERLRNVAGAFALRCPEKLEGKKVILIDDVFTSGATMNECAAVLKSAGADHVTAFTLARAL